MKQPEKPAGILSGITTEKNEQIEKSLAAMKETMGSIKSMPAGESASGGEGDHYAGQGMAF